MQDPDTQHPPTDEDVPEKCTDGADHKWRKLFGKFGISKGPGWRGAKGYWGKV